MDLTPYLDSVAADLDKATALADEHVRDVAHRLAAALEPGLRLALVRAVSDTAAHISTELDDVVVTVTLAGAEPLIGVTRTARVEPVPPTPPAPPSPPGGPEEDDGGLARISLRLPEQLKARAEEHAARAGQSLNTFLVQTVRRATSGEDSPQTHAPTATHGSRRITGWA